MPSELTPEHATLVEVRLARIEELERALAHGEDRALAAEARERALREADRLHRSLVDLLWGGLRTVLVEEPSARTNEIIRAVTEKARPLFAVLAATPAPALTYADAVRATHPVYYSGDDPAFAPPAPPDARAHDYRSPEFTERLAKLFQPGGRFSAFYEDGLVYETEAEFAAAIQRALVEGEVSDAE